MNCFKSLPAFVIFSFTAFILTFTVAFDAFAERSTPSCYSLFEAEAEQGIRIHSELMVIGLNCQHMTPANQQNYYKQYREFTNIYSDLISTYEETLINYFKKSGHPNPVASLNLMRTAFANKISTDAAKMRPDLFCRKYSPRIPVAMDMDQRQIRQWASTVYPSHPVSKPICEQ